ncbi:MAG: hypothetical protein LBG58_04340 [Planctomycetaceae bacterium]|jgi:hypothetical protein|nr:hypothetical protein [Planctomycetaceae bacterium]
MPTNNLPDSNRLTFEKVWQLVQETGKGLRELFQETDRRILEQIQESCDPQRKKEKMIGELCKPFGYFNQCFGELAEHLIAPEIIRLFNELGYLFHEVSRLEIIDDLNQTLIKIDLLLENEEIIVAAEVKTKPQENDITHHITRLNILREHFKKHKRPDKKIIGVIAGAVFDKQIQAKAIEAGFYTITQNGDTLNMDVPPDFQPRLF